MTRTQPLSLQELIKSKTFCGQKAGIVTLDYCRYICTAECRKSMPDNNPSWFDQISDVKKAV